MFRGFLASEFIAMQSFLVDLPIMLDPVDTKADTRRNVNGWLKTIQSFEFIAHLIMMCDIHEVNKEFSKNVQSDAMCFVDLPRMRDNFANGLKYLRDGNVEHHGRVYVDALAKKHTTLEDSTRLGFGPLFARHLSQQLRVRRHRFHSPTMWRSAMARTIQIQASPPPPHPPMQRTQRPAGACV